MIQAAEISFFQREFGLKNRVRSLDIPDGFKVEPLLLHVVKRQILWFGHLARLTPGYPLGEVFQPYLTGRRP